MVTAITQGIKVSVITEYQPFYSNPFQNHFVFSYKIRIENQSENTIQLMRRHWYIVDSIGRNYEVEGEGVVGVQPVIESGEHYEYVSGCNLSSSMGKMFGTFLVERLIDGKEMRVEIPEFNLIVPFLLN